jgi:hypothetical protein
LKFGAFLLDKVEDPLVSLICDFFVRIYLSYQKCGREARPKICGKRQKCPDWVDLLLLRLELSQNFILFLNQSTLFKFLKSREALSFHRLVVLSAPKFNQ